MNTTYHKNERITQHISSVLERKCWNNVNVTYSVLMENFESVAQVAYTQGLMEGSKQGYIAGATANITEAFKAV
jgi:hypothetical protein